MAWERPDQFRKVYSTIGSFTNIRGGNKYPDMVRTTAKKPIRIFQQDGTNDIVNQFGSWPEANKAMAAALEEKGYDHKFVLGEGTHNARHGGIDPSGRPPLAVARREVILPGESERGRAGSRTGPPSRSSSMPDRS